MFPLPNQNPGTATVHYSLCIKRKGVLLYIFRFLQCTTLLALSFRLLYLGFLSSSALNNRIENLTLITKFRGALRQCLFCLQVAPALVQYILLNYIIRYLSVSCIFCTVILLITIFTLILTLIYYLVCLIL